MSHLFNNIFELTLVIFLKIILFLFDCCPDFSNTCLKLLLKLLHLILIEEVSWSFWLNIKIDRTVIFVVEGVVWLENNGLGSTLSSQHVIISKLWLIIIMLQFLDLLINHIRTATFCTSSLIVGTWMVAFSEPIENFCRLRVNGTIIRMRIIIHIRLIHNFVRSTCYPSKSWYELFINKWLALLSIRSKLLGHEITALNASV